MLDDACVLRQLLIGVRDAAAVPRPVCLLIDHLCADPAWIERV